MSLFTRLLLKGAKLLEVRRLCIVRIVFGFSLPHLYPMARLQFLFSSTFLPPLFVPCVSFDLFFLAMLNSSICYPPSHSLRPLTLTCFFFSRVSPPTCSSELCPVPCGSHGVCSEGQCQCEEGWIGAACDQRACHPRCEEHGQCHDGTCICQPGWEGEHCNIGEPGAVACGRRSFVTCDAFICII